MAIVRQSRTSDSYSIADVICQSITQLCIADHKNQSDILERWLANKTPEIIETWIAADDSHCVTAVDDSKTVVGFGMLSCQGELKLLYVSPDQIGTGAGRAMLSEIERCAISWGLEKIDLDSTDSALKFYKRQGYSHKGACDPRADGLSCNGMSKILAKEQSD